MLWGIRQPECHFYTGSRHLVGVGNGVPEAVQKTLLRGEGGRGESETMVTASVLKQDQNT